MRFRILSGNIPPENVPEDLKVIHEGQATRVEAAQNVLVIKSARDTTILAVGTVVGRRTPEGRLQAIESLSSFISRLVEERPPASWKDAYEGDMVLIVVRSNGEVIVSGDRFFKRDVYVQEFSGGVALAADLDLLPENPALQGYDAAALAHSLTYYGHRPPKRHTIYRSVRRLAPGDVASIREGSISVDSTAFQPVPVREFSEQEHERYYDAFLEHLAAAGSPDGNSLFFSSGWDSSSILAGLVEVFGASKVTGFLGHNVYSLRSGTNNQFEMDRAQAIAKHYGIRLHVVELDYVNAGPDWIERVQKTFRAHNIQSMTGVNHLRLAHAASEIAPGAPIFTGEISDGAHNLGFSQYATIFHPTQEFREYSDKMAGYLFGPTFTHEFLNDRHTEDAIFQLFRSRAGDTIFDEAPEGRGPRMRQMLVSFFLRNGRIPLWSGRNLRMLTPQGLEGYTDEMASTYFTGIEDSEPEELYSWYLSLYNSFHWQGSTVSTIQKTADMVGLPAHSPYWDGALQDLFSIMPESWGRGLNLTPTKFPLKFMMEHKLGFPMHLQKGPHSYTYDIDPAFNHSIELMHHSSLAPLVRKIFSDKPYHEVLSPEIFDLSYIDGLADRFVAGEEQRGMALADLLSVWLLCQSGWYS